MSPYPRKQLQNSVENQRNPENLGVHHLPVGRLIFVPSKTLLQKHWGYTQETAIFGAISNAIPTDTEATQAAVMEQQPEVVDLGHEPWFMGQVDQFSCD